MSEISFYGGHPIAWPSETIKFRVINGDLCFYSDEAVWRQAHMVYARLERWGA